MSGPGCLGLITTYTDTLAGVCTHLSVQSYPYCSDQDVMGMHQIMHLENLTCLCLDLSGFSHRRRQVDTATDALLAGLTRLPHLQDLTLEGATTSPCLPTMSQLRCLQLMQHTYDSRRLINMKGPKVDDLRSLTQLTRLTHEMSGVCMTSGLPNLYIPTSLQHLQLLSGSLMPNVASVSCLTSMTINALELRPEQGIFQWPSSCLHLRELCVQYMTTCLRLSNWVIPAEWQRYCSLKKLTLQRPTALPEWFANMQHLTALHLHSPAFDAYPTCLAQLTKLNSLHMLLVTQVHLNNSVSELAHLPF